jgi:hypothetical protein
MQHPPQNFLFKAGSVLWSADRAPTAVTVMAMLEGLAGPGPIYYDHLAFRTFGVSHPKQLKSFLLMLRADRKSETTLELRVEEATQGTASGWLLLQTAALLNSFLYHWRG